MIVVPRVFLVPGNAPAQTQHNWIATQKEALTFGPVDAAASFLPVLLARLGASTVQVGLLSAIPNLAGFLLAVPLGQFLQGRRNVGPWYSRGRFINQLALPAIGVTLILLPSVEAVPVILVIMGLSAVVGSFANFCFYTVMDGLAGPNGRYELMGRRWGMKGAATAVGLAVIGFILSEVPFPQSYQLVFVLTAVMVVAGFRYARTFRIPDQPPRRPAQGVRSPRQRALAFAAEVGGERRFIKFIARHAVFVFGLSMAIPLIPLYYVRHLGASDAWIGLIGTTQALLTMCGYYLWRRTARRRGGGIWVLVISTIGVAAFPVALAFTQAELVVACIVGAYGISMAGIELGIFDELMKSVPADQAVRFAALDQGATNFAGMTGPLAGAGLAAAVGIPGGLVAAGLMTLVGAILFGLSVAPRRGGEAARVEPRSGQTASPIGDPSLADAANDG